MGDEAPNKIKNCHIVNNGTDIFIAGFDESDSMTLRINKFSLVTKQWTDQPYSFGYSIISSGMTWSGKV